jgi:hypothetical protein
MYSAGAGGRKMVSGALGKVDNAHAFLPTRSARKKSNG